MEKENKKTESSSTNGGILFKIKSMMATEPFMVGVGAVCCVLTLFFALACVSFFFTGAEDQSLLKMEGLNPEYLHENIKNWTGLWGARIADFLINRTFGIPSLFYLFYLGVAGLWLLKIRPFAGRMGWLFLVCTFFMVWGSIFLGSFIDGYDSSFLYLGGEHGYNLNIQLKANIGTLGVMALLMVALLLFSFYAFNGCYDFFMSLLNRASGQQVGQKDPAVVDAAASANDDIDNNKNENLTKVDVMTSDTPVSTATSDDASGDVEGVRKDPTITLTDVLNGDDGDDMGIQRMSSDTPSTHDQDPFANTDATDGMDVLTPGLVTVPFEITPTTTTVIEGESQDGVDFVIEERVEEKVDDSQTSKLYDPTRDLENYRKPTLDLFEQYVVESNVDLDEQNKNKTRIQELLKSFGVEISSIKATVGPTVTLYEVTPAPGVRISKIRNLGSDIALNLAAKGVRIIAPIPGKGTIGIEVPNEKALVVPMGDIIASKKFQDCKYELPIALGKTITNEIFMLDLCKMPHVLVAGATGQGKSVGLNAIITSLLYKKHPSELKFVMVDPKMVEFSMYSPIEHHFLAKMPDEEEAIITDVRKVVQTLNSLCIEMDQRYELLKEASVRQVKEYNEKFVNRMLNPEKGHHYMPYIVVVVDEFADLIMQVGKEVETPIARIAQKARAVGIHMILATQRPSANVITGVIRANFPARFAFRVSSGIDSRVVLDCMGAEQLIGRGDMLISTGQDMDRVQCALVDTPEVERIAKHISQQQGYPTAFILPEYVEEGAEEGGKAEVDLSRRDPLFNEVAQDVVSSQMGSTSMIQRKYSIGYNRAGRIMDQLEAAGIVGPAAGSKPRQVMIQDIVYLETLLNSL